MKKRHSIHVLLAATVLLLATAACTKDELANGDRLPEGQYPLEIAGITLGVEGGEAQPWGAPQTRVSETGDGKGSVFNTGDEFAVQIEGNTQTGIYTLQADGSATAEMPVYWSDRENHKVNAWYPATDGTLDLRDQQTNGLAYLLSGTGTGKYSDPVTLNFTHALAKVRITPSDDALGEVQSLQLYSYTQCTYEKGKTKQGSQEGWIEMKKCKYTENGATITCWEANVVPGYEIKKLRANGTEERDLSADITPEAGKFYEITLNYDKGYNLSADGRTYEVYNANGLLAWNEAARNDLSINCALTADIDLTGKEWTPIGTESQPYTGTFDGGDHIITGLIVTGSNDYAGLFGRIGEGGTVKNVVLTDVSVAGGSMVGGVAGQNNGTVENCSVNGTVKGTGFSDTGGITGINNGKISGCKAEGTVEGEVNVGGIAGGSYFGATIEGCHSTTAVSGSSSVGGVVGNLGNGCSLMACYSTGSVTATITSGNAYAGGVVGWNSQGTVTGCYHANGSVSGQADNIGGIVGSNNSGTFTACYWSGLPDNDNGGATKVDGTDVTWADAVNDMNTALNGSSWQYEPTGELPTLKKQ